MKKKTKKVKKIVTYAFIDASNIIYGTAKYGWKMDFEKLSNYLRGRYDAIRILYYAGVDNKNLKQLAFYETLGKFGIELRLVPVKKFADGRKKADVDSKMTFEIMRYFDKFDRAIVMTGDGDFYWVLEYLFENKLDVKLLSHTKTTAHELKKLFGSKFTDLAGLRKIVEFKVKK